MVMANKNDNTAMITIPNPGNFSSNEGHWKQLTLENPEKVPFSHTLQDSVELTLNVPGGHISHSWDPGLTATLPVGQSKQSVFPNPSEYDPGGQGRQDVYESE